MHDGFYTGASAMHYENERAQSLVNNLANASTAAFLKDRMVLRTRKENEFRRFLDPAIKRSTPNFYGVERNGIYTEFTPPTSRIRTDNPMNISLSPNLSNAFFAVRGGSPAAPQTWYTRNGHLSIEAMDASNPSSPQVLHIGGYVALDEQNQPITLDSAAGPLVIGSDGEIFQNDNSVGHLPVFRMNKSNDPLNQQNANLQLLEKKGDLLFSISSRADKNIFAMPIATDQNSCLIQQGELEGSNVETISEMVSMMTCKTNFAENQSLMRLQVDSLSKLFQFARGS